MPDLPSWATPEVCRIVGQRVAELALDADTPLDSPDADHRVHEWIARNPHRNAGIIRAVLAELKEKTKKR